MSTCIDKCNLPTGENDLKVLVCQLQREVKKLLQTTDAKLLLMNGKIAECCSYLKDNLSNSIRCLLSDMKNSGELDKIITEVVMCSVNKRVIFMDTVAKMKESILQVGDVIQTLGFYEINDGGAAIYKIREPKVDDNENSGLLHFTVNNLVAEIIAKETLNIKQLGAKDNEDCTNVFKSLSKFKGIKIFLPKATYYLSDIIDLENINLEGNDTKIIAKSQATEREHLIHFTGVTKLKNISFIQNCNTSMCYFGNTQDSVIERCRFIVNKFKCNGYVDLYTNNNNIVFKNCYFDCYSVVNGVAHGGGIWVREYNANKTSKNITFENCEIKHYSKDETIAVWNWNGKVENVTIDNNYIHDYEDCPSPHFITIAIDTGKLINSRIERKGKSCSASDHISIVKSIFDNVVYKPTIQNCKFDLDTPLYTAIFNGGSIVKNCEVINKNKCKVNSGSELIFEGCNFTLEKFNLNSSKFNNCTFKMTNNKPAISQDSAICQGGLTLTNCKFYDFIFGAFFLQIIYANSKVILDNVKFINPNIDKLNQFINSSVEYEQHINNCDVYKNVYMPKAKGYLINCRLSAWIDGDYKGSTKTNNNFICL